MSSLLPGFEYDIFISYRHKDNKYDGWVSEFVAYLRKELEATFKEDISIYFDENPHDGLLETHHVDKSLEGKLKCLIFIPNLRMVSHAYADVGLYEKSEEFSLNAFRLDKDSAQLIATKSVMERFNHNYESALLFANKLYQLDSSNWGYVEQKAWLLSLLGRNQEALDTWLNWTHDNNAPSWNLHRIGYSYWVLGNKKNAYDYFNRMIKFGNEAIQLGYSTARYDLAGVYAFLGEKEKAYQYLDEFVSKQNFFPFWLIALIKEDPLFEKIRKDDRFKKIVQQMEEKNNAERNRVIQWLEKEEMKTKVERY